MTDTVGRCGYCAAEPESAIVARVRAQVAAEMADTLDNKILRIREMAEATRALAAACRNAFADQPMPEAWRDLFARVDEAYAAWQYVEPTDG